MKALLVAFVLAVLVGSAAAQSAYAPPYTVRAAQDTFLVFTTASSGVRQVECDTDGLFWIRFRKLGNLGRALPDSSIGNAAYAVSKARVFLLPNGYDSASIDFVSGTYFDVNAR